MKVLAEAEANAAISILHALGLGKGCSIGIDLKMKVELVSEVQEVEADHHSLLDSIEFIWRQNGLPLPDDFGWRISSNIPIGQGLKSSSALSCAALKALNNATWAGLNDFEIIDLAVSSQRHAGCTISGSMDDTWAAISSGWKLVDPSQKAEESILLKGDLEENTYQIFLILRGRRSNDINAQKFKEQSKIFNRALGLLSGESIFHAMSANGMAVAAATGDDDALRICNQAIVNGAISAAITGSGPVISVVCFGQENSTMREYLSRTDYEIIETNFSNKKLIGLVNL